MSILITKSIVKTTYTFIIQEIILMRNVDRTNIKSVSESGKIRGLKTNENGMKGGLDLSIGQVLAIGNNGAGYLKIDYERLFRLSIRVINDLLNDHHRTILHHLSCCPTTLDYLSSISRATELSVMTTKRSLKKLCRIGLVKPVKNGNSYSYVKLTEFGDLFVKLI